MKTSFYTTLSLFLLHLNVLYSQSLQCGLIQACQKLRPHPKCKEVPQTVPLRCIITTTPSGPTSPWSPNTTPSTRITTDPSVSLPSQCSNYKTMNHKSRNVKHTAQHSCDKTDWRIPGQTSPDFKGPGWYRMLPPAGVKMSEEPVPYYRCGSHFTGWINGKHPANVGETATRKVCFNGTGNTCRHSIKTRITNCGSYFIYYFINTPDCYMRYCAIDS